MDKEAVHQWACRYFNLHPDTPPETVIELISKGLRIALFHANYPLSLFSPKY